MQQKGKKRLSEITGVTYKGHQILKIWYGRGTVLVVEQCTVYTYSVFSRKFKSPRPMNGKDVNRAVKEAKRWLRPPQDSIVIGSNKSGYIG